MGKSIASRFENIDIGKSVLRAVVINDDELALEMDLCLDEAHSDYEAPGEGDDCCFHPGSIKFAGISKLTLDRAEHPTGPNRRFSIQSFSIEGTKFDMSCDWGTIHLQARSTRVLTE